MGNHNSGRRPKPTALKVLQGNPGQKKLNDREPVPPMGAVGKPRVLSRAARDVWDEMAPVALAMGTLTTADVWTFGRLCELQATLNQTAAQKDDENPTLVEAAIKTEKQLSPVIRHFYEKFGLEPVGRARIALPKMDAPASKWA